MKKSRNLEHVKSKYPKSNFVFKFLKPNSKG